MVGDLTNSNNFLYRRNNRMDAEKAEKMAQLAEEQDALITAIDEEKMHLSDLEREIRRLEYAINRYKVLSQHG